MWFFSLLRSLKENPSQRKCDGAARKTYQAYWWRNSSAQLVLTQGWDGEEGNNCKERKYGGFHDDWKKYGSDEKDSLLKSVLSITGCGR